MSADVVLWGEAMSQEESPFHAIAAQALDDTPEVEADTGAAATGSTSPGQAQDQERDSLKAEVEVGQIKNGTHEAPEKTRSAEEDGEEETAGPLERKASVGVSPEAGAAEIGETVTKKSKKRTNVWTKTTSRKSAKKSNVKNGGARPLDTKDDQILLKPFHQEDDPAYPIMLSKFNKAEKIELSADRLAASGSKGYRMVRATRGVVEGAWFFEIYVERLGDTGHNRLGWSTRKGDLQAPVGYDAHSYAYRDLDGSKVHAALREEYGQAYFEKDVIGFYINLPRGADFKVEDDVVGYKGQPYTIVTDEPLKPLPGSEILFFRNGVCQGVAFKDVNDGSYFPAASMYTLPTQDCCKVVFNFGPDFKYPANDLGDRPFPSPMCQVSGPGESRVEVFPTSQVEVVAGSSDVIGGRQRMAPDRPNSDELEEEATIPAKAEKHAKGDGVAHFAKSKEKALVGVNTPTLSKMSKVAESRLNPGFKREVNQKGGQRDATGDGLISASSLSSKGGKKSTTGEKLGPMSLGSQKGPKKVVTGEGIGSTGLPTQKGSKKRNFGEGLGPGGLPSQDRGKNEASGEGLASAVLPGPKVGSKKDGAGAVSSGWFSQKAGKKDTTGPQLGPASLPPQKRVKKDLPAERVLSLPKFSSLHGMPPAKGGKKGHSGAAETILKGSIKDPSRAGELGVKESKKNTMGTGFPSQKGTRKDTAGEQLQSPKGIHRDGPSQGLQGSNRDMNLQILQGSKRDFPESGFPSQQGSKRSNSGAGLLRHKGNKIDTSGTGLPNSKRIKGDTTPTEPALKSGKKDVSGLGLPFRGNKKDSAGIQSVPKASKKDLTGTVVRAGVESILMGRSSWGKGIKGDNVDVVVVQSSNSYQEASFR